MTEYDKLHYLPNDILVKLDRATMSVGLEGRVPFLDPRLIKFSEKIPFSLKVKNNSNKWILKELLKEKFRKFMELS